MRIITRRIPWEGYQRNETYMGFDVVLNQSGIVVLEQGVLWAYLVDMKPLRGGTRLACIQEVFDHILKQHECAAAAIENGAYEAGGRLFELGGVSAILQVALTQRNIPYLLVPPTSLKKYWTGNHQARKRKMVDRANDLLGSDAFDRKSDDDLADAFALAKLAHDHVHPESIRSRHAMEVARSLTYEDHTWQTIPDIVWDSLP